MSTNKVLVYGSLRPKHYNYRGEKVLKDNVKVFGYKLFSLGSYPGIVYTGDPKDCVICTLLECDNRTSYNWDAMEHGANYHSKAEIVEVAETLVAAKIYEYLGRTDDENLVESGDWNDILVKSEPKYAY